MQWCRWTVTDICSHSTNRGRGGSFRSMWTIFTGTERVSEFDLNQILSESLAPWNRAEFLFLEPKPWWAPSVQTVLTRSGRTGLQGHFGSGTSENRGAAEYSCQSIPTTRIIHEQVQSGPVTGIVMIVEEQMRDCLLLLGRLGRLGRAHPPVLLVIPDHFTTLIPLLLESGSSAVMKQSNVSDIRIADWCRRVAASDDSTVLQLHARTPRLR